MPTWEASLVTAGVAAFVALLRFALPDLEFGAQGADHKPFKLRRVFKLLGVMILYGVMGLLALALTGGVETVRQAVAIGLAAQIIVAKAAEATRNHLTRD